MRKRLGLFFGAGCLLMLQTVAQAAVITSNPTFVVGDKTFNNFTCSVTTFGGGGLPSDCSGITVTGTTINGLFGIQFQLGGNVTQPSSSLDFLIGYDVTVTGSSQLITDIHMSFDGNISGGGSTNVTETVRTIPGNVAIGQISVKNPPPVLDAVIDLSQMVSTAHVVKDIFLGVDNRGGAANISSITQTFSQTGVPEPTSVVLLGSVLLGVTSLIRRRARA